jgi:outer membrane receptor protein involved in Fe transport
LRLAGARSLVLTAGYRLHGMGGRAPATDRLEAIDSTALGHVFFGAAQYLREERLNVALTFSQGFRVPNLNEAVMVGDTGKYFHVPNYDLMAERSDTLELRVRARAWRLSVGASGYASFIDGLIRREETTWEGQTEIDGKPVAWNVNSGAGLIWGVEGHVDIDIGWGLSLLGSLTYTWGEGRAGESEGVPMTRIPPLFGQATLRYEGRVRQRLTLFVEVFARFAARQDRLSPEDEADARIPEGGTPGWWTLNARTGVQVPRLLSVRLGLENLCNETYRYHGSGVDGAGTSATLAIELLL